MVETAQRSIVTMTGRTLTFTGDLEDAYFRGLEAFHHGSPQFEQLIRGSLAPDSNCADVGANIGLTAALLSTYCPNGRVYAVEASPKNAHFLRENVARNGLENCAVVESAIGNRSGTLAFLETGFGAGSHVLSARGANAQMPGARVVPVTTLDALFPGGAGSPRIDFMKLDVEGFEPVALSGGARMIERDRCTIFMEFNSWCLQLLHEFNPFVFARSLATTFDIATIDKDGKPEHVAPGDVHGFMYRNILQKGCVDDIVLRLKGGAKLPPLAEMIKGADDLANYREVHRLRREIRARDARLYSFGRWLASPIKAAAAEPVFSSAMDLDPPSSPQTTMPEKQWQAPPADGAETGKNVRLQLLRAIAILLVLGAHLSISNTLLMQLPFPIGNPGWIGVELFFVVSGYVVLQSFERSRFSVASFVTRRVFRLYPLLVAFLVMTVLTKLICDALVTSPPPLFSPTLEALWYQAVAIVLAYHPTAEWGSTFANGALWSLSVELRFYGALAALVAISRIFSGDRLAHRRHILIAAAAVYVIGVSARILICFGVTYGIADLIISKMYDFIALGTIVALLPAAISARLACAVRPVAWALLVAPLGLVVAIGSPYQTAGQNPAPFNLAMIAIGIAFALLIVAFTSDNERNPLSTRLGAFGNYLGDRSYAIFLLHLPVFNIAWALAQNLGLGGGYWQWPLFQLSASIIILVPLVELAHRWIELPMIDLGKHASARLSELVRDLLPARAPATLSPPSLRWERVG